MALSREVLLREIGGAKAAVKSHKEGAIVNQIVLEAFQAKLAKLPKLKK